MPTAFDMFRDSFFKAGRTERQELLNKTLSRKLVLEIASGSGSDELKGRMIKSLLQLELDKEVPDAETVRFARKHLDALFNREILKGGKTTKTITFTDEELSIIESALKSYAK